MSDFGDEVLYTLDGVREIAQDLGYLLKNLPSIASHQRKIKKLRRYFLENLPEKFTKSPQYKADIVWDMGMFIGVITLDVTEEGVDYIADYTQEDDEKMCARAKQIVAEVLPSVSNPPFLTHVMFEVPFPNVRYNVDGGKLPHTEKNA
ncbi:hypothetical protein AALC17_14840 [Oscillospiraceae bacterium 38-13]